MAVLVLENKSFGLISSDTESRSSIVCEMQAVKSKAVKNLKEISRLLSLADYVDLAKLFI